MLDTLLWKTVEKRPLWDRDGYLNWVVLERHRLHGHYRTTLVNDKWEKTHVRRFGGSVGNGGENDAN